MNTEYESHPDTVKQQFMRKQAHECIETELYDWSLYKSYLMQWYTEQTVDEFCISEKEFDELKEQYESSK